MSLPGGPGAGRWYWNAVISAVRPAPPTALWTPGSLATTGTWPLPPGVGFDNYTPLGRKEFGGTAALPIWINYMREALRDSPETERPLPAGHCSCQDRPRHRATGQLRAAQRNFRVFPGRARTPTEVRRKRVLAQAARVLMI